MEMRKCPFCGGFGDRLKVESGFKGYWVMCWECDTEGPFAHSQEEAVERWNKGSADSEMLDWLIGKMDEGVCTQGAYEWFLDDKQGRLQLRQVGYSVHINCGVEWKDFAGAGATVREAIEAAMKKEKEDGITTE